MKTIFTAAIIFLSTGLFAGNDTAANVSDRAKAALIAHISQLVGDGETLQALGINGQADVTVELDQNGVLHVKEVESNDFMLQYHIRQSIEGVKMIVEESLVGKTFTFIMNAVQSK